MTVDSRWTAVAIAWVVAGCGLLPAGIVASGPRVPDTVGIVMQVDGSGPDPRYVLGDGRIISVPPDTNYFGGGSPQIGELFLSGRIPAFWVTHATPREAGERIPAGCFDLEGETRADSLHIYKTLRDAAQEEAVLVFQKATTWTDRGYFKEDMLLGQRTCISVLGLALAQH